MALGFLLLSCAAVMHAVSRERIGQVPGEELLYYPSGVMVRQAAMGYETAAADLAWLRGIQYYGHHRLTDQMYGLIGHVMEIVTDLDPHFIQPYVFGAFVLAQELKRPDRALELLEKGIRANPENWELPFETGFFHYICMRDFATAGRYFAWASRIPGHPDYAERFAAFANRRAGNNEMAILLWKRVLATGNSYMQVVARRELTLLGVR